MNVESKIMEQVKSVLASFGNKYIDDQGGLKRNKVIEDLNNYNKDLMSALLDNNQIHNQYTEKVADVEVFKLNQFVDVFEYKEFWQDSFTKYTNRIGLTSNDKFISDSTDVVLDFPYKDTVLKAGMSKEDVDKTVGANEPFLNEVLAHSEISELFEPKVLINAKRHDKNGALDSVDFNNDNLILKGNNLVALHSIKKRYADKIKLILIDPPYNTGSDSFKYNDSFTNAAWLTFMKSRLEISRDLLSNDGVILISIDENEEAYLKLLCNDIFGEENFIQNFHIQVRYANKSLNERNDFQPIMEYVLAYAKSKTAIKPNKPQKPYDMSKFSLSIKELSKPDKTITVDNRKVDVFYPESFEIVKKENKNYDFNLFKETWVTGSIYSGTGHGKMYQKVVEPRRNEDGLGCLYKIYGLGEDGLGYRYMTGPQKATAKFGKMYNQVPLEKRDGIVNGTYNKELPIINYYDFSANYGNIRQEGGIPFNGGKKPEKMLEMFIKMFTDAGDIVMDYHLGSGSTVAAAHKLRRHYIGIEQMDYISNVVKRLDSVIGGEQSGISKNINWQGGGSFVYAELMEKNMGYLKDLEAATNVDELDSVYKRMKQGGDYDFRVDLNKYENDPERKEMSFEKQRDLLIRMLNKNQLYYNEGNIDDADVRELISDTDYQFNKNFYRKGID